MLVHGLTRVLVINGTKNENSSLMVSDSMLSYFSFSSFQALIGKILKPKSGSIKGGCLLCVANPESNVV